MMILLNWSNESVLFEAGFLLLSIIPRGIGLFWYPPIVSRISLKLRDIFTILGTLNNSSDWLIESLDSKINIKIIIKPLELLINDKCKFFNFYKWTFIVYFMLDLMMGFSKTRIPINWLVYRNIRSLLPLKRLAVSKLVSLDWPQIRF